MADDKHDDKANPATRPKRENGQQDHEGVPHKPEEFDRMNPARPGEKQENQ